MYPRQLALIVASATVFGALVLLFVRANASQAVDIADDELAQARARYDRRQSRAAANTPNMPVAPAATRPQRPQPSQSSTGAAQNDNQPTRPVNDSLIGQRPDPRPHNPAAEVRERRREIRRLYDRGDYAEALAAARTFLQDDPSQRYVLRVATTSACALGEEQVAREYFATMTETDQRIVRKRCERHNLEL